MREGEELTNDSLDGSSLVLQEFGPSPGYLESSRGLLRESDPSPSGSNVFCRVHRVLSMG